MSTQISNNSISVFPYLMYIDNSIFFFDHVEMLILALLLPMFYVQCDGGNCIMVIFIYFDVLHAFEMKLSSS